MLRKLVLKISLILDYIAQTALVVLTLSVLGFIILRWLKIPSWGAFEVILIVQTVVFVFGWPQNQVMKRHVSVDIIILKAGPVLKRILVFIMGLLSFITSILMVLSSEQLTTRVFNQKQYVSELLRLPLFPIIAAMG